MNKDHISRRGILPYFLIIGLLIGVTTSCKTPSKPAPRTLGEASAEEEAAPTVASVKTVDPPPPLEVVELSDLYGPKSGAAHKLVPVFHVVGERLIFLRYDQDEPRAPALEMWVSDGSTQGTRELTGMCMTEARRENDMQLGGDCRNIYRVDTTDSALFVFQNAPLAKRLMISDGTQQGTHNMQDWVPDDAYGDVRLLNQRLSGGHLIFVLTQGNEPDEYTIWASDGTAEGTRLLTTVGLSMHPGRAFRWPGPFVERDGKIYFMAMDDEHGLKLRVMDDSGDQGHRVLAPSDKMRSLEELAAVDDGSAEGSGRVADICPGACSAGLGDMIEWGNQVVFSADDGTYGSELWRSDGTPEGTEMLHDMCPGDCSWEPRALGVVGKYLVFEATDQSGSELWFSDGSVAAPLGELCPGECSTHLKRVEQVADKLFVDAQIEEAGEHIRKLWVVRTVGGSGKVKGAKKTK